MKGKAAHCRLWSPQAEAAWSSGGGCMCRALPSWLSAALPPDEKEVGSLSLQGRYGFCYISSGESTCACLSSRTWDSECLNIGLANLKGSGNGRTRCECQLQLQLVPSSRPQGFCPIEHSAGTWTRRPHSVLLASHQRCFPFAHWSTWACQNLGKFGWAL